MLKLKSCRIDVYIGHLQWCRKTAGTQPPQRTKYSFLSLLSAGILSLSDLENHMGIGGSMLGIALGIEPVFYILHSFIDKLVATYQAISPEHKIGGGLWNTTKPLAGLFYFINLFEGS